MGTLGRLVKSVLALYISCWVVFINTLLRGLTLRQTAATASEENLSLGDKSHNKSSSFGLLVAFAAYLVSSESDTGESEDKTEAQSGHRGVRSMSLPTTIQRSSSIRERRRVLSGQSGPQQPRRNSISQINKSSQTFLLKEKKHLTEDSHLVSNKLEATLKISYLNSLMEAKEGKNGFNKEQLQAANKQEASGNLMSIDGECDNITKVKMDEEKSNKLIKDVEQQLASIVVKRPSSNDLPKPTSWASMATSSIKCRKALMQQRGRAFTFPDIVIQPRARTVSEQAEESDQVMPLPVIPRHKKWKSCHTLSTTNHQKAQKKLHNRQQHSSSSENQTAPSGGEICNKTTVRRVVAYNNNMHHHHHNKKQLWNRIHNSRQRRCVTAEKIKTEIIPRAPEVLVAQKAYQRGP